MSVAVLAPPDQIRLHRAPSIDPPFDDELFPSLFQPHLHEAYFEPSPLVTAGCSPEGHTAALRFLNLCLELFNGFRSPAQMRPLLDLQQVFHLHDELADISRHLSRHRRRHPNAKVRRSQLRTCEPVPGVIEVAAVLTDGARTWALCLRIERQKDEWRCTFLHALLPPDAPESRRLPQPQRTTTAGRTPSATPPQPRHRPATPQAPAPQRSTTTGRTASATPPQPPHRPATSTTPQAPAPQRTTAGRANPVAPSQTPRAGSSAPPPAPPQRTASQQRQGRHPQGADVASSQPDPQPPGSGPPPGWRAGPASAAEATRNAAAQADPDSTPVAAAKRTAADRKTQR
jgi:uncharacterized protein DUF6459